jgi:hypothetical protein
MFETLREGMGEKGIRVFRNLDDALEWVLDKNIAPEGLPRPGSLLYSAR